MPHKSVARQSVFVPCKVNLVPSKSKENLPTVSATWYSTSTSKSSPSKSERDEWIIFKNLSAFSLWSVSTLVHNWSSTFLSWCFFAPQSINVLERVRKFRWVTQREPHPSFLVFLEAVIFSWCFLVMGSWFSLQVYLQFLPSYWPNGCPFHWNLNVRFVSITQQHPSIWSILRLKKCSKEDFISCHLTGLMQ